jgi:hypothetical protein
MMKHSLKGKRRRISGLIPNILGGKETNSGKKIGLFIYWKGERNSPELWNFLFKYVNVLKRKLKHSYFDKIL